MHAAAKNTIPTRSWKKRCLIFDRKSDSIIRSSQLQLQMQYVSGPEERQYARLPNLVLSLNGGSNLLARDDFSTVLDLRDNVLPFYESVGRWRRDCGLKSRMHTFRRSLFTGWQNVAMIPFSASGRGPLFVSVPE